MLEYVGTHRELLPFLFPVFVPSFSSCSSFLRLLCDLPCPLLPPHPPLPFLLTMPPLRWAAEQIRLFLCVCIICTWPFANPPPSSYCCMTVELSILAQQFIMMALAHLPLKFLLVLETMGAWFQKLLLISSQWLSLADFISCN